MTVLPRISIPDVSVVGGGPAGAVCALLLARAGMRVTLIHRRRKGVSPVELVSARVRRRLETLLDSPLAELMPALEIVETVSRWGTSPPAAWSAMLNPYGYGLAVRRDSFDDAILGACQRAGVDVHGNTAVRHVTRAARRWSLAVRHGWTTEKLRCRILVLANGSGRPTLVDRKPTKRPGQLAIMAHVDKEIPEQRHSLFVESVEDGWWYGLPDPEGGHFFGYCTRWRPEDRVKPPRERFLRRLKGPQLLGNRPRSGARVVQVMGRPAGPLSFDRVVGEDWVAVGDAAFVSDPLSGMGIDFAVESAVYAAETLFSSDRAGSFARYGEAVTEYALRHTEASARYGDLMERSAGPSSGLA